VSQVSLSILLSSMQIISVLGISTGNCGMERSSGWYWDWDLIRSQIFHGGSKAHEIRRLIELHLAMFE
jgi:hypothetical protein